MFHLSYIFISRTSLRQGYVGQQGTKIAEKNLLSQYEFILIHIVDTSQSPIGIQWHAHYGETS